LAGHLKGKAKREDRRPRRGEGLGIAKKLPWRGKTVSAKEKRCNQESAWKSEGTGSLWKRAVHFEIPSILSWGGGPEDGLPEGKFAGEIGKRGAQGKEKKKSEKNKKGYPLKARGTFKKRKKTGGGPKKARSEMGKLVTGKRAKTLDRVVIGAPRKKLSGQGIEERGVQEEKLRGVSRGPRP